MGRLASTTFLVGLVLSPAAFAATVEPIQKPVFLDQGDGFRSLSRRVSAGPGARVMAASGGSAQIVYSDGCVVKVEPGTVVTVQAIAGDELDDKSLRPRESPCKRRLTWLPLGVAAAIVGGAFAISTIDDDDNPPKPASP